LYAAALEEVVVTARRTAESLQDVPAAVTNFGGEALQDSGISDLSGIANITPSLVFAPSPGVGVNPPVAIRGASAKRRHGLNSRSSGWCLSG